MELDPVVLARAQFAFTISFHFIFPAFSIGLASYLMVLEALWLKTGRGVYANLYRYWLKIFAVVFGMWHTTTHTSNSRSTKPKRRDLIEIAPLELPRIW